MPTVETSTRICGIVPGTVLCVLNEARVADVPVEDVPEYTTPLRFSEIVTDPVLVCIKVNGEFAGVHWEPTALLVQAAAVPEPGSIVIRSKNTLPDGVLNVMKSVTGKEPVTGGPVKFWIVPPVRPAKEPVLGVPAVIWFATSLVEEKKIPLLDAVSITRTVPFQLAIPETLVANAGTAARVEPAMITVKNCPNFIFVESPPS
ncbi:MAG: hypothetical protein JO033_13600 [Acidobacteriaceae bacterium]|nr:hypothetical protein [Acidobacteriaceae bacterium]